MSKSDAKFVIYAPNSSMHKVFAKLVLMTSPTSPTSPSLQALSQDRASHLGHHCRPRMVTEVQSHSRWKPAEYVTRWRGYTANQNTVVVTFNCVHSILTYFMWKSKFVITLLRIARKIVVTRRLLENTLEMRINGVLNDKSQSAKASA